MDDDMVFCCRRAVDFSRASVRAHSASTRERTWLRSVGDIIRFFLCCSLLRASSSMSLYLYASMHISYLLANLNSLSI